jgi:hypothetical protein
MESGTKSIALFVRHNSITVHDLLYSITLIPYSVATVCGLLQNSVSFAKSENPVAADEFTLTD